ncbi:MAG: isochorismatase family protein [Deltaproteobacteria bacterium]|nr:isochorismatase family protein [Deltaproteobacteria bacterium]
MSIWRNTSVTEVLICGLATDYCVKFTALDALRRGYKTVVLAYLCRAVNMNPNDEAKALDELQKAGAAIHQADC